MLILAPRWSKSWEIFKISVKAMWDAAVQCPFVYRLRKNRPDFDRNLNADFGSSSTVMNNFNFFEKFQNRCKSLGKTLQGSFVYHLRKINDILRGNWRYPNVTESLRWVFSKFWSFQNRSESPGKQYESHLLKKKGFFTKSNFYVYLFFHFMYLKKLDSFAK